MSRIWVVGSANVDLVTTVQRIPTAGETVSGGDLVTAFGGKGANQAVAAARLGGQVYFVGSLGGDASGELYLAHLIDEGIDVSLVSRSTRPNGCALIAVDGNGANIIVVAPGANQDMTSDRLHAFAAAVKPEDLVLLQFEIPMATNLRAAHIAREAGARVIVNPSPLAPCEDLLAMGVDVLVLNDHEARQLSGDHPGGLLERVREAVIVTRGEQPALLYTSAGATQVPACAVEPVDTVGAGDTFTGAIAVALSEGQSWPEAVAFAHRAAACSTLALGAQAAMPRRAEL